MFMLKNNNDNICAACVDSLPPSGGQWQTDLCLDDLWMSYISVRNGMV